MDRLKLLHEENCLRRYEEGKKKERELKRKRKRGRLITVEEEEIEGQTEGEGENPKEKCYRKRIIDEMGMEEETERKEKLEQQLWQVRRRSRPSDGRRRGAGGREGGGVPCIEPKDT